MGVAQGCSVSLLVRGYSLVRGFIFRGSTVFPPFTNSLLPPCCYWLKTFIHHNIVYDFYYLLSHVVSLDLKTVRNALWVARNHWYSIGIGLNFEPSTLDAIRYRYHGADRCLIEVILEWLSCAVPQPSWGALVEALESNSVNYPDLAAKIRREYMKQE